MAIRNNTGCLCRVPVTEAAVPVFASATQLHEWAASNGVELMLDHRGRQSIDLPTAYRLYEAQVAADLEHTRKEAERVARAKAEIVEAQQRRQDTFTAARNKAVHRGKSHAEASQIGWEAVHKIEKDLPERVKHQLGGVKVLASAGHMGGLAARAGSAGVAGDVA